MGSLREHSAAGICVGLLASICISIVNAQPPFNCTAFSAVPPIVRSTGAAELMSDVILSCTGGTPTPSGSPVPQYRIGLFLNTSVTNRLLSGLWTDSLLLIDEPAPENQEICNGCTINGVGAEPGVDYSTVPNVHQGRLISVNGLEFPGVPIDPPGALAIRVIRITNVRANASAQPPSGLVPGTINLWIAPIGAPGLPIQNTSLVVGFTGDGLSVSAPPPQTVAACAPGFFPVNVKVNELFATALKRRSEAVTSPLNPDVSPPPEDQNIPGSLYFSETGFFNSSFPNLPGRGNLGAAGLADFGSRVLVRVNNVPTGILLFTATTVWTKDGQGQPSGGALRLIRTARGEFDPKGSSASGFASVPVISGVGWAVYEVMDATPFVVEQAEIPLYVAYSSASQPGTATVSAQFVPQSLVPLPTASEPIPRFGNTAGVPQDLFTIQACPPQ